MSALETMKNQSQSKKSSSVSREDLLNNVEFKQGMSDTFNAMMNMSAEERLVAVEMLMEFVELTTNNA
jgi:hypothetical protein